MPKLLPHVREDICRTARQMLVEENSTDFSIRSVAVRCGIGMGTIYNYFSSKEEIIAEILLADWHVILRRMDHANRSPDSPLHRLEIQYGLLREFLSVFHGAWIKQGASSLNQAELQKHRCRKNDYRAQLAERIAMAVHPETGAGAADDPSMVQADLLARLFLSCAPEADYPFSRIAEAVEALIPLCARAAKGTSPGKPGSAYPMAACPG